MINYCGQRFLTQTLPEWPNQYSCLLNRPDNLLCDMKKQINTQASLIQFCRTASPLGRCVRESWAHSRTIRCVSCCLHWHRRWCCWWCIRSSGRYQTVASPSSRRRCRFWTGFLRRGWQWEGTKARGQRGREAHFSFDDSLQKSLPVASAASCAVTPSGSPTPGELK